MSRIPVNNAAKAAVLDDLAAIARRAARCADNAQIAALEIRDRAEAAQSSGLTDDDVTEIRRMLNHMTVSLAGADRELGDLNGRAAQLWATAGASNTPDETEGEDSAAHS